MRFQTTCEIWHCFYFILFGSAAPRWAAENTNAKNSLIKTTNFRVREFYLTTQFVLMIYLTGVRFEAVYFTLNGHEEPC